MKSFSPLSHETLTPREVETLELMAEGLSNKEIAHRLVVEVSTVKWYVRQIYSKLNVMESLLPRYKRRVAVERGRSIGLISTADAPLFDPKHNIPARVASLIGREGELADLHSFVSDHSMRLITILGQGGMGKTRLAVEFAWEVVKRMSEFGFERVCFVPLQSANHRSQIVATIADNCGYPFPLDRRTGMQQVLNYLSNKRWLLVLDNYEHLRDETEFLIELLRVASQIQIVVTSRERLNLSGETVLKLDGMKWADWPSVEDALEYPVVRLFLQGARAINPGYILHEGNLPALVQICQLVEGMPLGILLAAAWTEILSLNEIAGEIANSIDFLESELRDLPDRHRSIRAVFDYSWNLLDGYEQDAMQRLSVFKDGFTYEAAQSVAGVNLKMLSKLVSKSLLQSEPEYSRLSMHPLLRQFAEEQLDLSGEGECARDLHSAFFAGFLAKYEPAIKRHTESRLTAIETLYADINALYDQTRPPEQVNSPLIEPLTDRENEILRLVEQGLSNRDIAGQLVISIATVKTHLNRVFSKLDVKSRTQAILKGKKSGILPPR